MLESEMPCSSKLTCPDYFHEIEFEVDVQSQGHQAPVPFVPFGLFVFEFYLKDRYLTVLFMCQVQITFLIISITKLLDAD